MPLVNLTRINRAAEKKNVNVSAVKLDFSDIPSSLDEYQLFSLPANVMVTNIITRIVVASQAGVTCDIGFQGEAFIAKPSLDTVGGIAVPTAKDTNTGKVITLKPSAALTQGVFIVMVEYIEYTLNNGEYTNFIPAIT